MAITIQVNGERRTLDGEPPTVRTLVEHLGLTQQAVAVEVNRRVVPKGNHANHALGNGDVVEVVTLVGGG